MHNAFQNGVTSLNFDVDQYALDIHFFFKLSVSHRADYKSISSVTNSTAQYALKHSTTRWITLRKVVVRLIEQHENLKEYIFTFMPTTASFKTSVKNTPCYIRICNILKNENTLPYLTFIVYFATDFEIFLTKFQSMKPLIYILYIEMHKLLWNNKHQEKQGEKSAVSATGLLLIDSSEKKVCKPLKLIDIGTKAIFFFKTDSF